MMPLVFLVGDKETNKLLDGCDNSVAIWEIVGYSYDYSKIFGVWRLTNTYTKIPGIMSFENTSISIVIVLEIFESNLSYRGPIVS